LEHYELINSSEYEVYAPTVNIKKEVLNYRTVTKKRKCNTCVEIDGCPEAEKNK